jgi:hypothetical protein
VNVVVFAGPTIDAVTGRALLPSAIFLPPAGCGDLYRACRLEPLAIALIDGVFDQRLAIWHKEILWALTQGIPVYGASSMGALRAAELHAFGMIGVGAIFESFRDGVLERDDEVTLAHETSERGYRPISEALVNIRATLDHAVESGVLGAAQARQLAAASATLFYPQRSYERLLQAAEGQLDSVTFETFKARLSGLIVNRKRLDAELLLTTIARDLEGSARPPAPTFHLSYTEAWHELRRQVDADAGRKPSS